MTRLFSLWFLFIFSSFGWAQQDVFQGRIDLGKDLIALEKVAPTSGTLYLLTGTAAEVRIISESPFLARVDFVEAEWKDEAHLVGHHTTLEFSGSAWAPKLAVKRPRDGADSLIYPYRKFQVAATADGAGFRVVAVPLLF